MKLIIAGSRHYGVPAEFIEWCLYHHEISEIDYVITGLARGIDRSGEKFADKYCIPKMEYPADWDEFGKAAGHIRNKQMAEAGDALLLIWDGESKGSKNMKENMVKLNKPVYEIILQVKSE